MNREDIIRMARAAGWDMEWGGTTVEQVMAFAEVVAAAEREALMKVLDLCDEAMSWDLGGEPLPTLEIEARKAIAAIRARGGE